jgi:predicted permease
MSDAAPRKDTSAVDHVDLVDRARLYSLLLLTILGWILVGTVVYFDRPDPRNLISNQQVFQGISPAILACYSFHSKYSAIIIAFATGISIGVSYIFGTFLYKKFRETSGSERTLFFEAVNESMRGTANHDLRELMGQFREYEQAIIDRRNVYWSLFTRVTLAILVVALIALLMSTCKIESQAGLPIISGIIAFIIGQGSETLHSGGSPILLVRKDAEREPVPRPSETPSSGNA